MWYYHYADIANILYTEVGYILHASQYLDINFGLQYDTSWDTGHALLGTQDTRTFGMSIEFVAEETGIHLFMAYNKDNSSTGANSLSLGGGALFTSMEDQTLDAMGQAGESWSFGLSYHLDTLGVKGLITRIFYGSFIADNRTNYHVTELDTHIDYQMNDDFSVTLSYADIDSKTDILTDYHNLRVIANYNF